MTKPVILTGLRANNDLHIGNYLGAIMPLVDMATSKAETHQINIFVPDLHSFTTPIDHTQLQAQIMQNLRIFVAAGLPLDHPDVHIYRQSYLPAHSELTWILDCFTYMGEMNRMIQFKDKSAQAASSSDSPSVGIFNYPVLMAADILLYGAQYVPVGDDQSQHIEFTRDIAQRINAKFNEDIFVVPHEVKAQHEFFGKEQGLRIRDLQDPTKKMSKSDETGNGVIFLSDSPDVASKKIMSAVTDSDESVQYNYERQPGVANLLDILTLMGGHRDEFVGQAQYGPLKTNVADKVGEFLNNFQQKLAQVNDEAILSKLQSSEQQMNEQANAVLYRVQQAVGLRAR